jgi:hypothetical protein
VITSQCYCSHKVPTLQSMHYDFILRTSCTWTKLQVWLYVTMNVDKIKWINQHQLSWQVAFCKNTAAFGRICRFPSIAIVASHGWITLSSPLSLVTLCQQIFSFLLNMHYENDVLFVYLIGLLVSVPVSTSALRHGYFFSLPDMRTHTSGCADLPAFKIFKMA